MAGPVAAVYLWLDGRRRCRLAAAVPLCAVGPGAARPWPWAGGRSTALSASTDGRPARRHVRLRACCMRPRRSPKTWSWATSGSKAKTTPAQGVMISLILLGLWAFHRGRDQGILRVQPAGMRRGGLGAGKLPGRVDRSRLLAVSFPQNNQPGNDRAMVRRRAADRGRSVRRRLVLRPALARQPTGRAATDRSPKPSGGNRGHRFDGGPAGAEPSPGRSALAKLGAPAVATQEEKKFPTLALQSLRAHWLLLDRADWQRRHLRRLDQAQEVAARLGIGRDGIRAVLGRLDMPELPDVYDAAGLLDLPGRGRLTDRDTIRRALAPYVFRESEPRPPWLPARRALAAARSAALVGVGRRCIGMWPRPSGSGNWPPCCGVNLRPGELQGSLATLQEARRQTKTHKTTNGTATSNGRTNSPVNGSGLRTRS